MSENMQEMYNYRFVTNYYYLLIYILYIIYLYNTIPILYNKYYLFIYLYTLAGQAIMNIIKYHTYIFKVIKTI